MFALGKWNAFFQLYGFFALEVTQHDLHLVTIKGCYAFFFSLCFISLSIFDLDFSVALPDLWCFLPLTPVLNVCIDMRGVSLTMHFNSGTWQNREGGLGLLGGAHPCPPHQGTAPPEQQLEFITDLLDAAPPPEDEGSGSPKSR